MLDVMCYSNQHESAILESWHVSVGERKGVGVGGKQPITTGSADTNC
jgi:hypothetical protein